MKKAEKNGENSSSSQKKKSFGLQLGENNVAASIIGGIVEKGFSTPVSQPQVTVLPFPVARHRSHGPHWAPRSSDPKKGSSTHDNNEEDDGEDEDHTNFNLLAVNAKPVQRKQKKSLDLKQWKELTNDDNTTKYNGRTKPSDSKKGPSNINSEATKIHKQKADNVDIDAITMKSDDISEKIIVESKDEIMVDMKELNMQTSHDSTTMESEIDAENRARLQKMSTNEITEAQDEIMKKMNPALIKILQKRGQEKMSKRTSSSSTSGISSIDVKNQKASIISKTDNPQKTITQNPNHSNSGLESKSNSSSLWDTWSTNVESTRNLRFSLDGDVINDYDQIPGNVSGKGIFGSENATERDFIRTEGDPSAIGYTIKEALSLTRSVVPGQRALALHLLASVLYKAQENIYKNQTGSTLKIGNLNKNVDWEALWAFALGPEPELALSLRMCLDDNHNSVVIACAKVIQCVLSYDFNEHFFNISEKTGIYEKDIYTAPIFRSRPKIDVGFLHGGFWKYNTKPSNIFPFDETFKNNENEEEEQHTIKDDIVVATQDILSGLVRMGILPRIRYLLESDPSSSLEETLISILVSIARHSPTCVDAIMKCERLVQVIVKKFTTNNQMGVDFSKIKTVTLFKVLAKSGRCKEFIDNGTFQKLTWHLYRCAFGIDDWMNKEPEKVKLWSALLIEQLRLWKVCLQYGYCASYFADMFPALFIWLDVPSFEKLKGKNVICEFLAVTNEAYLVLEGLTRTLPNFYSKKTDHSESWSWSNVGPMIDLALKWISLKTDPELFTFLSLSKKDGLTLTLTPMLWVISAVFHMLFGVLKSVFPEDNSKKLPWLPDFVPKIGLHIIQNGLLTFSEVNKDSFIDFLSQCRHETDQETSLASFCCLNGLLKVVTLVNDLIKLNQNEIKFKSIEDASSAIADKILTDGILECSKSEMTTLLTNFMKLTSSSGQLSQSVEMFGRGGPAPGVGVGWGTAGGGFWSEKTLVAQMDARLVLQLVEMFSKNVTKEKISCVFDLLLLVGPRDKGIMVKSLYILLQPSNLKFLDFCIRGLKTFEWEYTEEEFLTFSENLTSHYKNRWLNIKKSKSKSKVKNSKKTKFSLDTIQEDVDQSIQSNLVTEWAHQRLPLPNHWFLSVISTVDLVNLPVKPTFPEVSRSGLFFLLGLESLSNHIPSNSIKGVPVIWKLHVLSVTLFAGLDILEEEKTRDVYSTLQEFYGKILDDKILEIGLNNCVDFLKFDQEIHDSYTTFIETLVENFAGASYGNLLYARQISVYLHRCVGSQIRLATWNSLSNIRALELLPPLEKCLGNQEGYLEPIEGDEMILEAYVKSWVSGALDKSVTRNSVAFTLVNHHLSCFIFGGDDVGEKVSLRNKLVKSILRDYSRKSDHEGMMLKLIRYKKVESCQKMDEGEDLLVPEIERRFVVLREACEGNATLLSIVEKLKKAIMEQQ